MKNIFTSYFKINSYLMFSFLYFTLYLLKIFFGFVKKVFMLFDKYFWFNFGYDESCFSKFLEVMSFQLKLKSVQVFQITVVLKSKY